jgi:hypothetical protein
MDSDVITTRGGFIEALLQQMYDDPNIYATGSLMLVTRDNFAIGAPKDMDDVLRYAHPSCSLLHVPRYKEMEQMADHGSPCVYNMMDAERRGYKIGSFPIELFTEHVSGTSWVKEHQIVWPNDYDVFIRPFITFLVSDEEQLLILQSQKDKDFSIIMLGENTQIRIWETTTRDIDNPYYEIRFQCTGEYVVIFSEHLKSLDENLVTEIKDAVIATGANKEFGLHDCMMVYERKHFQNAIALF